MQKKVIASCVAAALAGASGAVIAGPISAGSVNTYAAEALPNAVSVAVGNVAYQLTNPIAVGATGFFTYTLDTVIDTGATGPGACPTIPAITGLTVASGSLSTDGKTCKYGFTATSSVGANTIVSFTGGISEGVSSLATTGQIVATVNVLDSTAAPVAGEGGSVKVALSAKALAIQAVNSAAYTTALVGTDLDELSRLDVLATPPLTAFTGTPSDVTGSSTAVINVGAVRVSEVSAAFLGPDGKAFNFGSVTAENLEVIVGGPFVNGAKVGLRMGADCTGTVGTDVTIANNDTTAKIAIPSIIVTADTNTGDPYVVFACYTAPGGTPAKVMNPGQFTVAAEYDAQYGGQDITTVALGTSNVYNLGLNGVRVDIRNYVPAGAFGWISAYRIINTGAVAAAVRGQFIGQNGALVGTAQAITGSIQPGGVVVVSAADIENVLGATSAPGGVGPRLRLTADTDSIRVQSFACQPSGNCFLNSDAQEADGGGSDK